jgi:hypothetical protein
MWSVKSELFIDAKMLQHVIKANNGCCVGYVTVYDYNHGHEVT